MTNDFGMLERALGQTEAVIAEIRPEQAMLATPCPKWTVHDVVEHIVGGNLRNFTAMARGQTVDWEAPPEPLGNDWSGEFRNGAHGLLATWFQTDAAARRTDQQIAELAVHAWDLVAATELEMPLDDELAERALAWSRGVLRPELRGPDKAFAAEVPVPAEAPAYARLAGWFGRDPAWPPA